MRRWFCFDVGEVLIDETRIWSTWADVLGISRFTFLAAIGAAVAAGGDHTQAFEILDVPDWQAREPAVQEAYGGFAPHDLYPDAIPTLDALRDAGYGIAVVANQPARRHAELQALGVDPQVLAMSEAMGVAKPDPRFFAAALALMGDPDPGDVVYVGDRLDNDVRPAQAQGIRAVWLRRGPWGRVTPRPDDLSAPEASGLAELVARHAELWR